MIYKLESSRKRQSCYDIFIFNQFLIGRLEFICETLSYLSCVPALLFQPVIRMLVHLVLCQFMHSDTHPCVPGTKLGSRH